MPGWVLVGGDLSQGVTPAEEGGNRGRLFSEDDLMLNAGDTLGFIVFTICFKPA